MGGVGRNVGNVMRSERVRDLMYIWREGERESCSLTLMVSG